MVGAKKAKMKGNEAFNRHASVLLSLPLLYVTQAAVKR